MTAESADRPTTEQMFDALGGAAPLAPLTGGQMLSAARRLLGTLAASPGAVARKGGELAIDLAEVTVGRSEVEPEPGDRRFNHPAFTGNPLYRRVGQGYVATRQRVYELLDDLDLDEKSLARSRFVTTLVVEALAPTNGLAGNPEALEETFRTGGRNLVDGARHALHDARHNGGMPSMVDTRPFEIGETIAATPGAVVYRDEVIELIQYTPSTEQVRERPLLIVPPQINKYYILDLAPDRSMVEHLVAQGQQTFMISWLNPGPDQRDWDLDTYVTAIESAIDACLDITDADDLNITGVCAGGMTTAAMLGHLKSRGDERVNAATFIVTVLDWENPSMVSAVTSGPTVTASIARSQSAGVLEGAELSRFFSMLRPRDLIWSSFVNNYLLGRNPAAFDVLAWNVDNTNLPATLHADFMAVASENLLTRPGELEVLGDKVDLSAVTADAYVIGAVNDHITPWDACYRTVHLLGGSTEFVLSSAGHVQAMVNPPDNPKARYHTNVDCPEDPADWLAEADEHAGSWWGHWDEWLAARAGALCPAPAELGSDLHPAGTPAPGRYVHG